MTVDADLATLRRRITNYASVAQDHEGFAALARVEAELSRLREQRDAAQQDRNEYIDIAEREGARCARLQQALRDIIYRAENGRREGRPYDIRRIAREALAGPDTPADRRGFSGVCEESEGCESLWHYWRCPEHPDFGKPADSQEDKT